MSAARLAARCLTLLGPVPGPVAVLAPRSPRLAAALVAVVPCAADGEAPAAGIVVFLRTVARPAERQAALRGLQRRLPSGAPLLLVDHNQPRSLARRAFGIVALLATALRPARARYPGARELAALGFSVERLQLACGERVQLVLARSR